ncbi:MAG: hypothetical protein ACYDBY_04875 [Thermoanaerobaculia bacterium]
MSGIVVAAYSDVEHRCTKWLLDEGEPVKLVHTHPDGPGEERWWESVADLAGSREVLGNLVESLDAPSEEAAIPAARPDVLFSFYVRKLIPARILSIPAKGALNIYGSVGCGSRATVAKTPSPGRPSRRKGPSSSTAATTVPWRFPWRAPRGSRT